MKTGCGLFALLMLIVLVLAYVLNQSANRPQAGAASRQGGSMLEAVLDKVDYISNSLSLYDVNVRSHRSYGSDKLGVEFKLKNNGERTLEMVEVKVYLMDSQARDISEQVFTPIGYSNPLKPNYIWQLDSDRFYAIKNVPSEYESYRVVISDISFVGGDQGMIERTAEEQRRAANAAAAEQRVRNNASNDLAQTEAARKRKDEAQRSQFEYAKTQAEAGKVYYQRKLGEMYLRGQGTEIDIEQAKAWLIKAWGNGDQTASNLWQEAKGAGTVTK